MNDKTYDEGYLNQLQYVLAKTISRSLHVLNPQPGETICDVGCGAGDLTSKIAAYGASVIGIDNDENFLLTAKQAKPAKSNIQFICADADTIPLANDSIDKIIIHRVLQHIANHEAVLKECFRILKPGGTLQIVEPDYLSLSFFMDDISFERKLADMVAHYRIPNSYKIRKLPELLNMCGFTIILKEVHNYLIDSFELANYIVRFDTVVEKGYAANEFSQIQYEKWQNLKRQPKGQFNLSLNLVLIMTTKHRQKLIL